MKKILLILALLSFSASSIFAGIDSISIEAGIPNVAITVESKINNTTQIYVPLGIDTLNTVLHLKTPFYAGTILMKSFSTDDLVFKAGAGAEIFFHPNFPTDKYLTIFPVIRAELEQHFNENHSVF